MANPPKKTATDEEDAWLSALGARFPDMSTPGYWTLVAKNAETWAGELSAGQFWTEAKKKLDQWRTEYRADTGSELFVGVALPQFVSKSEKSIKEKLFRRYLNNNSTFGKSITSVGPLLPAIGDLVRTRLICSYIDGVEFMANKIVDLANELHVSNTRERQGKIEGYFAQHINLQQDVIYRIAGQSQMASISCEVQVASAMGTKMWEVSHALYEGTRRRPSDAENWQWKPTDPRFISNQLGHMIHLVDGLMVQLRDSSKGKK